MVSLICSHKHTGDPILDFSLGFQSVTRSPASLFGCDVGTSVHAVQIRTHYCARNEIYPLPDVHVVAGCVRIHRLSQAAVRFPFSLPPSCHVNSIWSYTCHLQAYSPVSSAAVLVLDLTVFQLGVYKTCPN